ncbi:MAG: hypothetical protein PHT69_16145 [Bacteroidales bacterium]|nr:hypothetical protein [Bacteroidales bacterium]
MHFKLTEEIIKLSNSQFWDKAKLEWCFEYAYYSEENETCLCGHSPIRNICVIKNTENENITEVGNCCINKFLGIKDANKIFTSIKKLKENISNSMSKEALVYLKSNNQLNSFEYSFYHSIIRKKILSDKQQDIKLKINRKFIDFTSYESNSIFRKINIVLKWAENNPWFNTDFVISLKTSCERTGKLTEKQKTALENIMSKMKIN